MILLVVVAVTIIVSIYMYIFIYIEYVYIYIHITVCDYCQYMVVILVVRDAVPPAIVTEDIPPGGSATGVAEGSLLPKGSTE